MAAIGGVLDLDHQLVAPGGAIQRAINLVGVVGVGLQVETSDGRGLAEVVGDGRSPRVQDNAHRRIPLRTLGRHRTVRDQSRVTADILHLPGAFTCEQVVGGAGALPSRRGGNPLGVGGDRPQTKQETERGGPEKHCRTGKTASNHGGRLTATVVGMNGTSPFGYP